MSIGNFGVCLVFNADLNDWSNTGGYVGRKNCEENDDYIDFSIKF